MKKLLILINCVLALLLCLSLWGALTGKSSAATEVAAPRTSSRNTPTTSSSSNPAPRNSVQWPSSEEGAAIISRKNVFNPQRSGLAGGRGVVTYSLVGIFRVGRVQGAIILTKGGPGGQVKQRFMLGETLPNGYTLEQIQNNQVILVNGSSKMVLTQALPSENFPGSGGRRRQPSQMEQMLDLMRQSLGMQQRQNANMMQMMRNNQGTMPQRGGSTNSRRR